MSVVCQRIGSSPGGARAAIPENRNELHREGGNVSTRIVFDGGAEVIVAQNEADVVQAIRRDHANPTTLESTAGRPLHVNWSHVIFMEETLSAQPDRT